MGIARRLLNLVVAMILLMVSVVVCANVFSRYAMNMSIFGSEDFALLLLLWMTFIGGIVVQHDRAHFAMPLFIDALSARGKRVAALVVDVVSLVTLAILAFSSLSLVTTYGASTQISLGIPKTLYAYPLVAGSFGMLAVVAFGLIDRARLHRRGREPLQARSHEH